MRAMKLPPYRNRMLLGALVNGIRTWTVGAPCLDQGEPVVMFLKSNGVDTFDIVNLAEGKFSVDLNAPDRAVSRDLRGIHFLDPTQPGVPTSLDELKNEVILATR